MFHRRDLNSASALLPRSLWKGTGKQHFLDISLTASLGLGNFANTLAKRIILFLKMLKILSRIQNLRKKIEKGFFFSQIIAFESVALNCFY